MFVRSNNENQEEEEKNVYDHKTAAQKETKFPSIHTYSYQRSGYIHGLMHKHTHKHVCTHIQTHSQNAIRDHIRETNSGRNHGRLTVKRANERIKKVKRLIGKYWANIRHDTGIQVWPRTQVKFVLGPISKLGLALSSSVATSLLAEFKYKLCCCCCRCCTLEMKYDF